MCTAAITAIAAAIAPAAGADLSEARTPDVSAAGVVLAQRAPQAGSTRAVLLYTRVIYRNETSRLTNPRVRISRDGKQVFAEAAPMHPRGKRYGNRPQPSLGHPASLVVRDLDGDREPDVIIQLTWGGTHCCDWSRVYRLTASESTYVAVNHWWGNSIAIPSLKDIEEDGKPEFLSRDDRFAALTGYANVVEPIQIWSYRHGNFRDVTRSYPQRISQDAARLWSLYRSARGKIGARYVLAAWAADQYMLGRAGVVDRAVAEALQRGYLAPKLGERPQDPVAYIGMMKRFLRKTGYIRG